MVISDFVFKYHCFKRCVATRSSRRQVGTEWATFRRISKLRSTVFPCHRIETVDGHWIDAAALRVSANQLKKGWILFLITIDVYTVAAFWFPSHHVFFCVKRQTETNFAICTAKLRTNSICTFKEIKPIISVVQLKEKAVMLRCASHASIFSFFTINQSASRGHGKFTATPKINFFLH